jgi:hypothetical protein
MWLCEFPKLITHGESCPVVDHKRSVNFKMTAREENNKKEGIECVTIGR